MHGKQQSPSGLSSRAPAQRCCSTLTARRPRPSGSSSRSSTRLGLFQASQFTLTYEVFDFVQAAVPAGTGSASSSAGVVCEKLGRARHLGVAVSERGHEGRVHRGPGHVHPVELQVGGRAGIVNDGRRADGGIDAH